LLILSATRSLALRALGLTATSGFAGINGRRVIILSKGCRLQVQTGASVGQVHDVASSLNVSFTIRSSRE